MPKQKVYPRITTTKGRELIKLLEPNTFNALYKDYPECKSTSKTPTISAYLRCYTKEPDAEVYFKNACEVMREWMQIESKLPVLVLTTETGIIFALPQTRDAVNKYRWLHRKALKYARRVMDYIHHVFGE